MNSSLKVIFFAAPHESDPEFSTFHMKDREAEKQDPELLVW